MSLSKRDKVATIYYPESDGKPMGETDFHIDLIADLRFSLRAFFRNRSDVYVASNLLLYYVEGNPRKFIVPDVFMVRGVGKERRRIYKLWEEGHSPNVVFEISSRQTWREDLQKKWHLYQKLGVEEYFVFDPEYDYLIEPLVAYRLKDGEYVKLKVRDGRVRSKELGLDLVDTGETLRLFDPKKGRFLPTPDEEADALRRSEAEVLRLQKEIESLRKSISSESK